MNDCSENLPSKEFIGKMINFIDEKVPRLENEPVFDWMLRKSEWWHHNDNPYKVSPKEMTDYL